MKERNISTSQLRTIYGFGNFLGLIDTEQPDKLHQYIECMYGKSHLKELTYIEIQYLIDYLKKQVEQVEKETGCITFKQKQYIEKLMKELSKLSKSKCSDNKRLSGIVSKVVNKEVSNRKPLTNLTKNDGSKIIETLKRFINTESNKRKEV